mmetsp:Transcript_24139/g.42094  ORF Transcript_24139/g.42094 Transcript_24139/m.42094 type:complete len:102 (+) Transcript_24139:92-397(+)
MLSKLQHLPHQFYRSCCRPFQHEVKQAETKNSDNISLPSMYLVYKCLLFFLFLFLSPVDVLLIITKKKKNKKKVSHTHTVIVAFLHVYHQCMFGYFQIRWS